MRRVCEETAVSICSARMERVVAPPAVSLKARTASAGVRPPGRGLTEGVERHGSTRPQFRHSSVARKAPGTGFSVSASESSHRLESICSLQMDPAVSLRLNASCNSGLTEQSQMGRLPFC